MIKFGKVTLGGNAGEVCSINLGGGKNLTFLKGYFVACESQKEMDCNAQIKESQISYKRTYWSKEIIVKTPDRQWD